MNSIAAEMYGCSSMVCKAWKKGKVILLIALVFLLVTASLCLTASYAKAEEFATVHFSSSDNVNITGVSLTKSVTAGESASFAFHTPSGGPDGEGFLYVYGPFEGASGFPGGIYAYGGTRAVVELYITAPAGYTFDLLGFQYAADFSTWSMNSIDVTYTSGGTGHTLSSSVLQDGTSGYSDFNMGGTSIDDVTEVKITVDQGYTEIQNIMIADIKNTSGDAGIAYVKGQAVAWGSQTGTAGNPITGSVIVSNSVNQIAIADITANNPNAVVWLSPDSEYMANVPSISLTAGTNTPVYIQIDAEDSSKTLFYAIDVFRNLPDMNSATVTMAAPIAGQAPQTAEEVQAETNDNDFEVTAVTWNGALTPGLKFKAGTVYTATVTLQSMNGRTFQAGSFTPTVDGASLVGTTTTTGLGIGNTVTFLVTFPVTDALTLTGIAVTFDPIHMSYTEEDYDILDLSGMVVTQTYNDGTTDTVAFADGTAEGYTTSPANGTVLTYASHDLTTVTVTHTSSGLTAQTISLSVTPAPTHEISLTPEDGGTFPSEVVGYTVSPTKNVTVTNIGTGSSGELFIELEGTNKNDFQISIISISGLLVSGSESFTVWPKAGLPVGTYTATVKVYGDRVATQSFDISFTVEHSYSLMLDVQDSIEFPAATVGYSATSSASVVVTNTSSIAVFPVTVSLEGDNKSDFQLSDTSLGLSPMAGATIAVWPKTGLAQGLHEATLKFSFNVSTFEHPEGEEISESIGISFNVLPIFRIELNPAGTYAFPAGIEGYGDQTPRSITVNNTGTDETGNLTVALSGGEDSNFVLSTEAIPSILISGSSSFTVVPKTGLANGNYIETVTVSGVSVSSQSFEVSFTVNPSYGISLDQNMDLDFPEATVGYNAQTPMTVTVSNTGTGATGILTVALSGANAGAFDLSKTSIPSLGLMGTDTFTVASKTGLAEGDYYATVTVSGTNVGSERFDISFCVNPTYGIELSPDETYTFPVAILGYGEQTALSVSVNNVGTGETGSLTIALSGTNSGSFELSSTSLGSIAASGSEGFTVKPVTGLGVGTYAATVTVSGGNVDAQILNISFTVDPEPTHIIGLNPSADHTFPAATVGYGVQTAYEVTVNSTGTGDSGTLIVTLSGTNADAFELSKTSISAIASSGSDSFTVTPKTGLAQGDYSATVTVSGGSVTSRSLDVSFTVEPSYSIALNPDDDYTFPEATAGYDAQSAYEVTVNNTGTGLTGALAIALSGADADAFELNKTSIANIAASLSDSFTIVPKTGLAADTYTATVTVSGAMVEQKSINITFKVNYVMNEGTLTEVVSPTTTIIAEGQFAQEARLIVTPLDEGDNDRDDLEGQASEKNAIAAYEVHVEPAEAFLPPLTLTFQVGEKYNGHTVYILHKLGNGNIDIYQPTVVNGEAVIIVQELSPFLLAIDPAVIIAQQPQSVTALIGTAATFTVTAEGLEPFSYRWQRRTSTNGQWKDIAGATGPSYTTTTLNKSHNGYAYRVIVTDVLSNSATSDEAVLTVTASPETGDASHPFVYAALTVIFAAAAILMLKKRKPA